MSKRLKIFIALWWGFWLTNAYLEADLKISLTTITLVVSSMLLFLIGWSIFEKWKIKRLVKRNYIYIDIEKILYPIIFIQIVMSFFSLLYSLNNPGSIRDIAYSNPEQIYKNPYILQIYSLIIFPTGFFAILSKNFFDLTIQKKILVLSLFVLDTLITFGRLSIYYLMVYIVVNAIIINKKNTIIKILIFIIVLNILMYILFNYRYSNELNISIENYFGYLKTSAFNYHIIGFKMLDEFINGTFTYNSESFLTFGFLEYLVTKFYSIFLPTVSNWAKFGEVLQGFVIKFEDGSYNALSTIFLPYYIDFGIIGPPIFLFIFGSIVGFGINRSGYITPLGILIIILILSGMLQSTTIGQLIYVPLIFILFGFRIK